MTASRDKTLRVWDVVTGGAPLKLVGHEKAVLAVECYGEGDARRAVSGGDDTTLLMWDLDKGGAPLLKLVGHEEAVRRSRATARATRGAP